MNSAPLSDAMNLAEVVTRQAQRQPQATAIIEGERTLSYEQLDRRIERLAAGLAGLGLGDGARIGLCLRDHADFLAAFFAIGKAGAASVLIDWRSSPSAKAQLADRLGAALVLREPDMPDIAGVRCAALDALLQSGMAAAPSQAAAPGGGRPQTILTSSGTTGAPKGMVVTHRQWMARLRAMDNIALASPDNRRFSAGPLVFSFFLHGCLHTLYTGRSLVLYPPLFTAPELVAAIDRYCADTVFLVPTIARRLLELAPPAGMLLPRLRNLVTAGAPLHAAEKQQISERVVPNIYDWFGAAGIGVTSCLHPDDIARHAGSVGRVLPGLTVEIVDAEDRPLPAGEIGRLRCGGPTIISAWAGPVGEDDPEFLRDGWYYTSDLASFDAEGYLYIEGRASDVINRGGATVFPAEIEGVLLDHPAVAEAAVVGYPAGNLGEEIAAFVVLRSAADTSELVGHCRDRLGPHKVPRRFVIRETLPKTSSGKIRKPDLAVQLWLETA